MKLAMKTHKIWYRTRTIGRNEAEPTFFARVRAKAGATEWSGAWVIGNTRAWAGARARDRARTRAGENYWRQLGVLG